MFHKTKFSIEEKIDIWLNLGDFSFKLLKENLTKKELEKMFKKTEKNI
jgi:hypothetical protein